MLIGVILVHGADQAENFRRILPAVSQLDGHVVVSGEGIPGSIPGSHVQGFNAGANRDIGIAEARRRFPGCSVVLLDGDCIPGPGWIRAHREATSGGYPILSCGARRESGNDDPRERPLDWQGNVYPPSFIPGGCPSIPLPEILAHRATWTCNLSINARALHLIEMLGLVVHGAPRIFAPMYDGIWGGEDTGLGILAHYAGCQIATLDPCVSAVEHVPHESRITSTRNLRMVAEYEAFVRKQASKWTCDA